MKQTRSSFTYNDQGRMSGVLNETFTANAVTSRTQLSYEYNTRGIRITALEETDANNDGTFETRHETRYLVDHRNSTGYAQTLEETLVDADTGTFISKKVYVLGHDQITQTEFTYDGAGNATSNINGETTHTLLADGHGSVRLLLDAASAIAQAYTYAAYGELLAIHNATAALVATTSAAALTAYLYSGEHTDSATGLQYLRARYYDPATGTFNRLDPFSGNIQDPQSLHKYLYTHGNPINGIDPTGRWLGVVAAFIGGFTLMALGGALAVRLVHFVTYDTPFVVAGGVLGVALTYLGFFQLGSIWRNLLGFDTQVVNIYVPPLDGPQGDDQVFRDFRANVLRKKGGIVSRLNAINVPVPEKNDGTVFHVIDGPLPQGESVGYSRSSKTLNIEVVWRDADAKVAQGIYGHINLWPNAFERQLKDLQENHNFPDLTDEEIGTYLANVMLHETAHNVLERSIFAQGYGQLDHRSGGGLMGGRSLIGWFNPNMEIREASQKILQFDGATQAQMRGALGGKWRNFH